jgi:hypothetical protein
MHSGVYFSFQKIMNTAENYKNRAESEFESGEVIQPREVEQGGEKEIDWSEFPPMTGLFF